MDYYNLTRKEAEEAKTAADETKNEAEAVRTAGEEAKAEAERVKTAAEEAKAAAEEDAGKAREEAQAAKQEAAAANAARNTAEENERKARKEAADAVAARKAAQDNDKFNSEKLSNTVGGMIARWEETAARETGGLFGGPSVKLEEEYLADLVDVLSVAVYSPNTTARMRANNVAWLLSSPDFEFNAYLETEQKLPKEQRAMLKRARAVWMKLTEGKSESSRSRIIENTMKRLYFPSATD